MAAGETKVLVSSDHLLLYRCAGGDAASVEVVEAVQLVTVATELPDGLRRGDGRLGEMAMMPSWRLWIVLERLSVRGW